MANDPPNQPPSPHRGFRRALRGGLRLLAWMLLVMLVLALFWLRHAIYNHVVRYPREAAAWAAIKAERQAVPPLPEWREFRGVIHSHSELSHDCEVPFDEILRVLQATGRDFICLSDHCDEGRADFSRQWRGIHEGKLFIPGFEMKEGLMPFGVAAGVVLSNATDASILASQVVESGGVLFYAHPEERRAWDRPELTGMEIYNIHADFKDRDQGLLRLLPDLLLNQRQYPDQVMRAIFDAPVANLRRWDDLNRTRHITGIAGNDCHQNTGIRAFYTGRGTVRIEDTSPKTLAEWSLNAVTRPLVRLCFGPLAPGRKLFHFQLDPYERMTRFVATHVLARELTEPAILDALRRGRALVGFDMIADSTGFQWLAQGDGGRAAVMGEKMAFSPGIRLIARSPHTCRFRILRDGEEVHREEGRTVAWPPTRPGKYRVEAELNLVGAWTPWVIANPIELGPGEAVAQPSVAGSESASRP